MKNTIRFVKEELTDDSNSCDFRKMMRGEKQIASLLCEEPHQPSPVRALGGSPQVLPRGDKPGSLTVRASLVALPVTWGPRRACLDACVSLRPLTVRDGPLTTWPGSQLLQVWKRDQYMPGMGSCGVRTDKPEGAEAGGRGAVGSLCGHTLETGHVAPAPPGSAGRVTLGCQ